MAENSDYICESTKVNMAAINRVKSSMNKELDVVRLSEIFKVLGDPTRIKIIYALSKYDMCVHEIAETLDMSQSAISHQLRLLRNLKLVKFKKEGKSVVYSLDDDHILQLFNQGMEHVNHS